MAWWVAPAIMAAGSIGSSLIKSSQARSQGAADYRTAMSNAYDTRIAGDTNSRAIETMAGMNASLTVGLTDLTESQRYQIALFNADLQSLMGDYNARLLENEEMLLWESVDLDLTQMEKQYRKQEGLMRVGYGASGVRLDQDTPLDAMVAAETEYEFEKFVVRHGADIQSQKLLDAAALSRWQGDVAAQQIATEGRFSYLTNTLNSRLQATGIVAQGAIDSAMTKYNANLDSNRYARSGYDALNYSSNMAKSYMISGLFNAGTTFAGAYIDSRVPNLTSSSTKTATIAQNYSPNNYYTQSILNNVG